VTLISRAGPVPRDTPFPEISFVAPQSTGLDGPFIYSLRLHARPAKHVDVEFRRGDSTGDGNTNIADAVHVLSWQFSGGAAPRCLEAADTSFDGNHNLTDGIFLLAFLFQGGQEPPAPGTKECGISRAPKFYSRRG